MSTAEHPGRAALGILRLQARIILHHAQKELERAEKYQKKYVGRHGRPVNNLSGQKVWSDATNLPLGQYSKVLRPKFIGPFVIQQMVGPKALRLEPAPPCLIDAVFHVALLKPAVEASSYLCCSEGCNSNVGKMSA